MTMQGARRLSPDTPVRLRIHEVAGLRHGKASVEAARVFVVYPVVNRWRRETDPVGLRP